MIGGWRKSLWTLDFPLKLNFFTWLVAENKVLSWDNLQRRGFEGPRYCSLCKKDSETMFHLFVGCPFACAFWERENFSLKFLGLWYDNTIPERFKN
jgi:hypothetical protein